VEENQKWRELKMVDYEKHLQEINQVKRYCNSCKEQKALFIFVDLTNNQEMDLCEVCRDEIVDLARKKDIDFQIKHISK